MINIVVIGAGYWGRNLIRNAYELEALHTICDCDDRSLAKLKKKYPGVEMENNINEVITNDLIDAVIIATPASTHYELTKKFLNAGKHVMVEKPFTLNMAEAKELVGLAETKGLKLMVGMTFIYNQAVRKVKDIIERGSLGEIYYIYFERVNLGKVRQDVNVWWNLAPHDISIALYWLDSEAETINASGESYLQKNIHDVVWANVKFKNGTNAFIHTSWLHPQKTRKSVIIGSRKMLIYDDTSSDMKIRIYDKGIDQKNISEKLSEYENFGQFQFIQRAGDILIPKIDFTEPLREEVSHFIECIRQDKVPITGGRWSSEIVNILAAGQKSLENKGINVKLNGE